MFIHKHVSVNNISLNNFPFQMELAMQSYILENPDVLNIESENLEDVEIIQNEATINNKRVDLLVKYSLDYLAIIELKKGEIKTKDLNQIKDYLEKRQVLFNKVKKENNDNINIEKFDDIKWMGILIGTNIEANLMQQIEKGIEYQKIPIIAMTMNRFKSEQGNVFIITDTYKPKKINSKDNTQYEFNGQVYGKGTLVLAVIKKYVEDYNVKKGNKITFPELKDTFPDSITGGSIFDSKEIAEEIFNKKSRKRHFIKPEQLIELSESVIAVSNQWGIGNIKKFIKKAKSLGYDIKELK